MEIGVRVDGTLDGRVDGERSVNLLAIKRLTEDSAPSTAQRRACVCMRVGLRTSDSDGRKAAAIGTSLPAAVGGRRNGRTP
jgi:hypothetical protein